MALRTLIKCGANDESLKRAADQTFASIREHLDTNSVVRLHVHSWSWIQVKRLGKSTREMRWTDGDELYVLSAVTKPAVMELLGYFKQGDFTNLRAGGAWKRTEAIQLPVTAETSADEPPPKLEEGEQCLYVLANDSMPGMVKVGRTDNEPDERARQLSSFTGVPTAFRVFRAFKVRDSVAAERSVHVRLSEYRVSENREFFAIGPEDAAEIIASMLAISTKTSETSDDEDERFSAALQLVLRKREVWHGMLSGYLGMSYEQADRCIDKMKTIGVVDAGGNVSADWTPSRDAPLTPTEHEENAVAHRDREDDRLTRAAKHSAEDAGADVRYGIPKSDAWDGKIEFGIFGRVGPGFVILMAAVAIFLLLARLG